MLAILQENIAGGAVMIIPVGHEGSARSRRAVGAKSAPPWVPSLEIIIFGIFFHSGVKTP
jgi:hypothetical protein